jgi:hypothetical protein
MLVCPAQSERADLIDELTRCVREPFFVFVVSNAFQPGDYLSGVAVLELERPLTVKEVVVGLRCHGRVRARACRRTTAGPFSLCLRSDSISFTRAQGIPGYKRGLGREKDGRVGEGLVEGGP